jgi:uncharacterized membrane protein YbhN (UPF0104 family)
MQPAEPARATGQTPVGGDADRGSTGRRPLVPTWVSLLLRLSVTALLMYLALKGVEWGKLTGLVERIDWRWWIAGLCTGMAVQVIAAIRWALLARPIGFPFSLGLFVWRTRRSIASPSNLRASASRCSRISRSTG